VQKPKNACILQMDEKEVMRCLRYQVASEQFQEHVNKHHKVLHCLPPDQGHMKFLSNHLPNSCRNHYTKMKLKATKSFTLGNIIQSIYTRRSYFLFSLIRAKGLHKFMIENIAKCQNTTIYLSKNSEYDAKKE
jgi:hypothetical protein